MCPHSSRHILEPWKKWSGFFYIILWAFFSDTAGFFTIKGGKLFAKNSESADFKERFGGRGSSTEQCVMPEHEDYSNTGYGVSKSLSF